MVVVSYSGKEINAKLVYYGAGLSGKTTNLEAIYEAVPDSSRGKMVSMKTQSDRTLFFDLLPLDLGEIMGFRTRFLLYTVPGQVFYNATRKLVLKGADAIVFVADSEVGKMEENKESLANLKANLAEYKLSIDEIPWVIQYNKRDLPNVYTIDELNAELNSGPGAVPSFEAVATQGKGVFETFRGISHLLMERVTKDLRRSPSSTTSAPPMPASAPRPPADPAPHRPITPAPPLAPARVIEREAQETKSAVSPADGSPFEYGRELDLPDEIPAAPAPRKLAPTPAPVASASASIAAEPASRSFQTLPGQAHSIATVPAPPALAPTAPALAPTAPALAPAATAPTAARNATAAPGASAPSTDAKTIVVPVTLAPGGTGEIVIRIVLQTD